jgi:SAM-dependent methyltransferase
VPSLDDNQGHWAAYDWKAAGDEWSEAWGGAAFEWWGALFPRIQTLLPAGTILEIAPGYGRWTQFLAPLCRSLIVVDVTERCIAACRERFAGYRHIAYHVNDGRTLPPLRDGSIDFAFSFDSLVHVEADVLGSYMEQLGAKLAPEGIGFFHHSNMGAFADPSTGTLSIPNLHWRATSVSASGFDEMCRRAGLVCIAQELVNWGGPHLTDCFSVFTPAGSKLSGLHLRTSNPEFMAEAGALKRLAGTWGPLHAAAREGRPQTRVPSRDRPSWLSRTIRRVGFR